MAFPHWLWASFKKGANGLISVEHFSKKKSSVAFPYEPTYSKV